MQVRIALSSSRIVYIMLPAHSFFCRSVAQYQPPNHLSTISMLVSMGGNVSTVSVTVLLPSGLLTVRVVMVVIVPSELTVFCLTCCVEGTLASTCRAPSAATTGRNTCSDLSCRRRVKPPATTQRIEAIMHRMPATPMLQS